MQVSKFTCPFVFLFKISLFIILLTFSFPLFAEYYFVRETKPANLFHSICHSAHHHQHHYVNKQKRAYLYKYKSDKTIYSYKTKHHHARTYIMPSHEISYDLDMITGDDDPYVYPGMNIDR